VFSVIFVSNFCFMVRQFLYIIGLHWAALGFLAVALCSAWLGESWQWMLDGHLYFTASFLVGGVSMDS
jgi:hypothetical protein